MFLEEVNEKLNKFFENFAHMKEFEMVIPNQDNICEETES
jgi:hypothetical protein